jgi:hypothetical protein
MTARTLLQARDRASLLERAARLQADTSPRWGRMNVPQMLRHCAEAMRMSLGEVHPRPLGKRIFHTRLAKHLIIRVFPFPKGAPTAPELRITDPAVLEVESARLGELIGRWAEPSRSETHAEHPLFGVLSREEWAELQYKHVDHHFTQFGL